MNDDVVQRLAVLPAERRRLFAASCAQDLLPDSVRHNPAHAALQQVLDRVWDGADPPRLVTDRDAVEALVPDVEDPAWDDETSGPAQDALTALLHALQRALDSDPEQAEAAAYAVVTSVDAAVLRTLSDGVITPEVEAAVQAAPVYRATVGRLEERLRLLEDPAAADLPRRLGRPLVGLGA